MKNLELLKKAVSDISQKTNELRKKLGNTNINILDNTKSIGKKEKIDLYIGLDVGTSSTKVVIREPEKNVVYLVDFDKYGIPDQKYLLPTYLTKVSNEICLCEYGRKPLYDNLKLKYLDWLKVDNREKSKSDYSLFLTYIVKTLEYVRDWFNKNYSNVGDVADKQILWHLNVGVPSKTYEDDTSEKYKSIALKAYEKVFLVKETPKKDAVDVTPEIIASANSYFNSRSETRIGMRFVCDVGAGTIDTCMFLAAPQQEEYKPGIYRDIIGKYEYSFFATDVKRLGTTTYMDILLNDKDAEVQEKIKSQFVSRLDAGGIELTQQDKDDIRKYKGEISKQIRNTIDISHDNGGYGKYFKAKIPLILVGGGAAIPLYPEAVNEVYSFELRNEGRTDERFLGFKMLDMDISIKYTTTSKDKIDNRRLLVALGLSYPKNYNVNKIVEMPRGTDTEKNSKEDRTLDWRHNH